MKETDKNCCRCGFDNSFIDSSELRFCIRCGEKLVQEKKKDEAEASLMTPDQVCKYLGVTKQTLYQYVHRNKLPCLKLGKNLRFEPKELRNFMEAK